MRSGPKKGFKQSTEHIRKKKRFGADHHAWKEADVSPALGRSRANRIFPEMGKCELCPAPARDRHHRDGNTANNTPGNVQKLCRRCHMVVDGRLKKMQNGPRPKGWKLTLEQRRAISVARLKRFRDLEAKGLKAPNKRKRKSRLK